MKKISFQLDINEVNLIIKALSERPFGEVYELIGKIHAQSSVQIPNQLTQTADNKQVK